MHVIHALAYVLFIYYIGQLLGIMLMKDNLIVGNKNYRGFISF